MAAKDGASFENSAFRKPLNFSIDTILSPTKVQRSSGRSYLDEKTKSGREKDIQNLVADDYKLSSNLCGGIQQSLLSSLNFYYAKDYSFDSRFPQVIPAMLKMERDKEDTGMEYLEVPKIAEDGGHKMADDSFPSPAHQQLSWLHCTRYKPPKLPRSKKTKDGPRKRKLGRNPRVPFTQHQVFLLEQKFKQTHYLSSIDVAELSANLNLTENRVKIWFQNRRARERREGETPNNNMNNNINNNDDDVSNDNVNDESSFANNNVHLQQQNHYHHQQQQYQRRQLSQQHFQQQFQQGLQMLEQQAQLPMSQSRQNVQKDREQLQQQQQQQQQHLCQQERLVPQHQQQMLLQHHLEQRSHQVSYNVDSFLNNDKEKHFCGNYVLLQQQQQNQQGLGAVPCYRHRDFASSLHDHYRQRRRHRQEAEDGTRIDSDDSQSTCIEVDVDDDDDADGRHIVDSRRGNSRPPSPQRSLADDS